MSVLSDEEKRIRIRKDTFAAFNQLTFPENTDAFFSIIEKAHRDIAAFTAQFRALHEIRTAFSEQLANYGKPRIHVDATCKHAKVPLTTKVQYTLSASTSVEDVFSLHDCFVCMYCSPYERSLFEISGFLHYRTRDFSELTGCQHKPVLSELLVEAVSLLVFFESIDQEEYFGIGAAEDFASVIPLIVSLRQQLFAALTTLSPSADLDAETTLVSFAAYNTADLSEVLGGTDHTLRSVILFLLRYCTSTRRGVWAVQLPTRWAGLLDLLDPNVIVGVDVTAFSPARWEEYNVFLEDGMSFQEAVSTVLALQ